MLHMGRRLYGKVDEVPGVCHVATPFFYINMIPLIPFQSVVVYGDSPQGPLVAAYRWSFKSILVTWARMILFVVTLPFLLYFIVMFNDNGWTRPTFTALAQTVLLAGVWIYSMKARFITQASVEEARRIAEESSLPMSVKDVLVASIKNMYIARGDVPPPEGWEDIDP